jgi:phosphotransferase system HPr (HPr) family protein
MQKTILASYNNRYKYAVTLLAHAAHATHVRTSLKTSSLRGRLTLQQYHKPDQGNHQADRGLFHNARRLQPFPNRCPTLLRLSKMDRRSILWINNGFPKASQGHADINHWRMVGMKNQVDLVVHTKVGLHAKPGALFVMAANKFESKIKISNLTIGSPLKDAKSVVSILSLRIKQGCEIHIEAEGPDAENAINTLQKLVESNFGEPN